MSLAGASKYVDIIYYHYGDDFKKIGEKRTHI